MNFKILLILVFLSFLTFSQNPTPPCGDDYGSNADETEIILQMRFGTTNQAVYAINQGKNTRGFSLGCPQTSLSYSPGNYTQPLLSNVADIWNSNHKPIIEGYNLNCPRIGRYENNAALGAYYAKLAGYYSDLGSLQSIGNMMEAQQYSTSNVSSVNNQHKGVYGYIHVGSLNSCYPGGVVGSSVNSICNTIASLCTTYDSGLFGGEDFLIGDQSEADNFYDGGIAYDHGWIGIQMIEAAIQQTDVVAKGKFKNSVELAALWAINEKEVKNHNYTAKLIWLLAEMYSWTGNIVYKDELNRKLDKNLLPGILMDSLGYVKGTNPAIAFTDLTPIAQTPGRMWDGHNALPWYSAMNAWAITEAYVAFRDQGDDIRAAELKPYAIAMLDNLAWEINNLGVIPDQLGVRDLTYSLLIGIWKIAQYENETHANWKSAAWALWNTGYFDAYSTHSVCVGLYLIVLSDTPYEPIHMREEFDSISNYQATNSLSVFPNPSDQKVQFKFDNFYSNQYTLVIYSADGKVVHQNTIHSNSTIINIEHLSNGIYPVVIQNEKGDELWRNKLVIDH